MRNLTWSVHVYTGNAIKLQKNKQNSTHPKFNTHCIYMYGGWISAINNETFHSNNEFCNVLRRLKIKLPKYDDFFNTCTLVILKTYERTQNFTKTELVHLHSGQHEVWRDKHGQCNGHTSQQRECFKTKQLLALVLPSSLVPQISLHRIKSGDEAGVVLTLSVSCFSSIHCRVDLLVCFLSLSYNHIHQTWYILPL